MVYLKSRFIPLLLCGIIFAFIISGTSLAKGPAVKVVLFPFDMHSESDIREIRRNLMETIASSLHKEGLEIAGLEKTKLFFEKGVTSFSEEDALSVSRESGADFALLGSLTLVDTRLSADWRIMDVKDGGLIKFYYESAASPEGLFSKIKESAPSMRAKMLSSLEKRPVTKEGLIEKISVEGVKRIDPEAILRKISTRTGQPFSGDDVKNDIHAVYGMGYFDDIAADLRDTDEGKELAYIVKEKPWIKNISIKGNKKKKEESIKEVITVKENTVIDHTIIKADTERIKALYIQEGFYLADITSEVITDGVDATVVFYINEAEKVKVKKITIIGNSAFSDKEIKGVMGTGEAGIFSFITGSGSFNEYVFENDLSLIMKQYFDHGYIKADILDYRVLLSEDKKWFFITIAVSEGEQYRVGNIDFTGDIIAEKKTLLKKLKMKKNEVFNRSKLGKGLDNLSELYGDEGFANAEFTPLTRIDDEKKMVDLTVKAEKHEPVYVERIDITGNVRTRDKVIRRELEFGEGELFSFSDLKKSRNNLKRLGYFEDVEIARGEGSAPDRVRLDVAVKERPTGMLTFGMGYSTVDKLIATASISQTNLIGTGLKLDLSGTIGSKSTQYVLGFTQPWLFDRPISAGIDLFKTSRDYPDFTIDKNGFDLRGGFPIYKRQTYGYLTYRLENADVTSVSSTASTIIESQKGKSTVSSVQALVKHDTRDDAFFPREGSTLMASVELAGGFFGGTTNYLKYEGSASRYFPLPWDTTFSLRGTAGYIEGFGGQDVPLYERYFLGGINSMRGFETRSVGPKDPLTGELIGGKTKLVLNAEYLFPIFPKESIRGLVFFDIGNAYESGIDFADLRKGAGVGIRWFSPVGPIRLEWGYNLNREKNEKQSIWEFTIGGVF